MVLGCLLLRSHSSATSRRHNEEVVRMGDDSVPPETHNVRKTFWGLPSEGGDPLACPASCISLWRTTNY